MKVISQLFNIQGIKCNNCVNDILNGLNQIETIIQSEVNINLNEIKIISKKKISANELQSYIKPKYKILEREEQCDSSIKTLSKTQQLYPLFLIFLYIFLSSIFLNIKEISVNSFMLDFMGLFFVVF